MYPLSSDSNLASTGAPVGHPGSDAAEAGPGTSMPAAAAAPSSSAVTGRLSRTTACLPIVYGSIAFYLGKKADEYQTHEWTLFLRGPDHEDLSPVISKVIFQLHPSFAQPIRELTHPPYQVTERGWGEFEAQIRIVWKAVPSTSAEVSSATASGAGGTAAATTTTTTPADPSSTLLTTTIVNHSIKLYPPGSPPNIPPHELMTVDTPVLAEVYDEVVFTDPTESFFRSLIQIASLPRLLPDGNSRSTDTAPTGEGRDEGNNDVVGAGDTKTTKVTSTTLLPHQRWREHLRGSVYDDQADFLALTAAQAFLKEELARVKERFAVVNQEMDEVDLKLVSAQQQKQREMAAAAAAAAAAATSVVTTITTATTNNTTTTTKGGGGSASGGSTGTNPAPLTGKKNKAPPRKRLPASANKKAKTSGGVAAGTSTGVSTTTKGPAGKGGGAASVSSSATASVKSVGPDKGRNITAGKTTGTTANVAASGSAGSLKVATKTLPAAAAAAKAAAAAAAAASAAKWTTTNKTSNPSTVSLTAIQAQAPTTATTATTTTGASGATTATGTVSSTTSTGAASTSTTASSGVVKTPAAKK